MSVRMKLSVLMIGTVIFAFLALFLGANPLSPYAFFTEYGVLSPLARMRVMRTICAFTAGGSLALAGLLLQCVLKNPLADPYVLGISGGAGLGAVTAFLFGLHMLSCYAVPCMAAVGSLVVLFLVLMFSKWGGYGLNSILISGVLLGTVLSGVLMYLISAVSVEDLAGVTWWMLGDLRCGNAALLIGGVLLLLIASVCVFFRARSLDLLAIGDDEAFFAGINPRAESVLFVIISSLLTAYTVSMCGILSFCGLIVPHFVRRFFGCSHRIVVPAAICGGGFFMILCDVISRSAFAEREIPPGAIAALLGCIIIFRKRS